ncbi:MAG: 30S ribosomal protein S4 [Deltaproteobacteria bacterium]|jgi:small subunit ribosomal protein S4|nr:30S ribosomal protein S4 [Deltaproteobacteria bacterium]MBW2578583.1 30S ribosomal protein S4 [Deltaproteobacteria bacterium]
MARYKDAVCRLCRREGTKLFLKGDRCFSAKCGIERRAYPPGQHGQGRARFSDYGVQLREQQKVKRMYGLLEKQFADTMSRASRMKGRAGGNLLVLLERRLDNVIFRMGFSTSRAEARQLVRHGHFLIDGRRASIPSMLVKAGAVISVAEKSRKIARISGALETLESRSIPQWVEINKESFEGTVKSLPVREDITMPIQEQLIVEWYSR